MVLFFLNITLFLIIFSEREGTIVTQSNESATLQMIANQSIYATITMIWASPRLSRHVTITPFLRALKK